MKGNSRESLMQTKIRKVFSLFVTFCFVVSSFGPSAQAVFAANENAGSKRLAAADVNGADKKAARRHEGARSVAKKADPAELARLTTAPIGFTDRASDHEISYSRILPLTLIPMADASGSNAENKELESALMTFLKRKERDDYSALTAFIKAHPNSRWNAALELNLGQLSFEISHFAAALSNWESAWARSRTQTRYDRKAIADEAISNLVLLEARLGRMNSLASHLAQLKGRTITGTAAERVESSRSGLWTMQNHPEVAFACGPQAIRVLAQKVSPQVAEKSSRALLKAPSTTKGTSLSQVKAWAADSGLDYQIAKRSPGAKIIPKSIMHWSVGHFAAILEQDGNVLKLQDPTFDNAGCIWITTKTLDTESDGYFLIPQGPLPPGWKTVSSEEAAKVWGKGVAQDTSKSKSRFCPKQCTTSCSPTCRRRPLATPDAFSMNGTSNIVDTPLVNEPPIGPDMSTLVTYVYQEAEQRKPYDYTNLGDDWSLGWVSYLKVVTVDANHNKIIVQLRGGGNEVNHGAFGVYEHNLLSQSTIVYDAVHSTWQRVMPDGSTEYFTRANVAGDVFFLTSVSDPEGNAFTIHYGAGTDDYWRITGITDACGNPDTTISYVSNTVGNSGYYKVAAVTDGFGRSCTFEYDSTNSYLEGITDAGGNKSAFAYEDGNSFINLLTTAYGSTLFEHYVPAGDYKVPPTGLKTTLPDKSYTVLENWPDLSVCSSYFWDREATELYPNDPNNHVYTHCKTTNWLYDQSNTQVPVAAWEHMPNEAPTMYWYVGQPGARGAGILNKPYQVAKQLTAIKNTASIGSVNTGNVLKIRLVDSALPPSTGESAGTRSVIYTVQSGDTPTTCATAMAAIVNNDPILQSFGISATSASNVITFTSYTCNNFDSTKFSNASTGSPTPSITFANGANPVNVFTFTGTVTVGNVYAVTISDSGLPGGQQTVSYTVQTGDTFGVVAQQLALAANANQNLQSQSISATWTTGPFVSLNTHPTNTANPVIQFASTSANATTYSGTINGSSSANFAKTSSVNGLVQAWNYNRTNWGAVSMAMDPVGRYFDYIYANINGIDLLKIIERNTIDNYFEGSWEYNAATAPHKPSRFTDTNGKITNYTYNSLGELATITDPYGSVTTFSYDSAGYLQQIQGPLSGSNDVTNFTFYGYGPVETVTDSEGYELTFYYDDLNRLTKAVYPDGTFSKNIYDKIDLVMSSDRDGRWTQYVYNNLDQLDHQIDPQGRRTSYCWCACGSLASITDAAQHTTSWHHDLQGRVIQKEYADGSHVDIAYETAGGRVLTQTDAQGQVTRYQYNLDNSIQVKRYANVVNATSQVVTTYDTKFPLVTKVTNGWGDLNYTYNPPIKNLSLSGTYLWVGGNPATGDTVNLTLKKPDIGYSYALPTFTVPAGDAGSTSKVATDLAALINTKTGITNMSATSTGPMISIASDRQYPAVAHTSTGTTTVNDGGALRAAQLDNSVISNSQISYSSDALERTTSSMINGTGNPSFWNYDEISRVTSEVNPLGTFNYAYVDNTSGSSKGVSRLASVTYPNGQTANFSWLPNIGDQRLQQIINKNATPTTLSQFEYAYSASGEIRQWRQVQNGTNKHLSLNYDLAGQLTAAPSDSGSAFKAYVSGTAHTGDVVSITAYDASLTGSSGQETASYTVQSGDTLANVASGLTTQITSVMGSNLSLSASASGSVISITTSPNHATQFTGAVTGAGATTTIALGKSSAVPNLHSQAYYSYDCAGNLIGKQGDSTGSFPSGLSTDALKFTYNNLNELTSSSAGGPIRFEATTTNPVISAVVNVSQTATVGGTVTTGDTLWLSVHDKALSGVENVSYVVQGGDTTTSIATALKNAINADSALSSIGVSATSSGAVITLSSSSRNAITFSSSLGSGASETITLSASKSEIASITPTTAFTAAPQLASGANTASVTAVSGGGTAATNSYPISINSLSTSTLTYDADGNMTSDGTNSFAWDAEHRLIKITYPGSNNFTDITYDGLGRAAKIVETTSGSVTSTRQFVWYGSQRCEERDGSGSLSNGKQFFELGQVNFASGTPTNYFYTTDHLGSTREMTKTVSGTTTIEAQYGYDPYGRVTKLSGSFDADFQYAGYYMHAPSGLNLTRYRAYNANLGRWLSRDPIADETFAQVVDTMATDNWEVKIALAMQDVETNLYTYSKNQPISLTDPLGLLPCKPKPESSANPPAPIPRPPASPKEACHMYCDYQTGVLLRECGRVTGPWGKILVCVPASLTFYLACHAACLLIKE